MEKTITIDGKVFERIERKRKTSDWCTQWEWWYGKVVINLAHYHGEENPYQATLQIEFDDEDLLELNSETHDDAESAVRAVLRKWTDTLHLLAVIAVPGGPLEAGTGR